MSAKLFKLSVIIACILLLTSSSAQAADAGTYRPSEWRSEKEYIDRAFGKFNFGIWNFFFGWTELATEPYESLMTDENFLWGIGKGVFNGLADTVGGAANIVTFPITALYIPLPEGGIEQHEF